MPVAPPPPKSLPLTALRAFEAAARLGGFTAAAAELGVTPGAVTAHVKALEEGLGAALFERQSKGVRLTALGAAAAGGFTEAFDALARAEAVLRARAAPQVVHVATLPAIAQLWLSPRLPALRAAAPEISVSITALEAPPNLKRAPYDLSLFPAATGGRLVAVDAVFPVCAPALADRLRRPEDLAAVPCLSDAAWAGDWDLWLAAAGVAVRPRGPVFSLYALAVEEAVNGAGVLMGHAALVADHLARGRLIAPFPQRVALPQGLRLWSARPMPRGSAVARVVEELSRGAP
ncbi:LysR family transcriptional regulator [Pseudogemmobacter blasticus]|uniref:LysR family transcriptional regulator n=1 Tax=Fuscovulum blasticum DSM 2131 TaxID=1188250 RepID=A0A2T4JCA4_FUSBL|nr:LysR family transcriptional regulator [Fuscovulum blasticum]PTE15519.1 LysR family transcriptional regulator [Fuscovulum blasticum DSM 2131]